jgi:hypothetical protein
MYNQRQTDERKHYNTVVQRRSEHKHAISENKRSDTDYVQCKNPSCGNYNHSKYNRCPNCFYWKCNHCGGTHKNTCNFCPKYGNQLVSNTCISIWECLDPTCKQVNQGDDRACLSCGTKHIHTSSSYRLEHTKPGPDQWACHSCTFHNNELMSHCEICNTPKP